MKILFRIFSSNQRLGIELLEDLTSTSGFVNYDFESETRDSTTGVSAESRAVVAP